MGKRKQTTGERIAGDYIHDLEMRASFARRIDRAIKRADQNGFDGGVAAMLDALKDMGYAEVAANALTRVSMQEAVKHG